MNLLIKIIILISILLTTENFSQIEVQSFLEGARITDIKQEGNYLWVATYGQGIYQYSLKDGNGQTIQVKPVTLKMIFSIV